MNSVVLTENQDKAFSSTGDCNLDFFLKITRGADFNNYIKIFIEAWNESHETAYKVLMNMRDIRNGKGEKLIPIAIMTYLKIVLDSTTYNSILDKFITYGCWKDVLRIYEMHCRYVGESVGCIRNSDNYELKLFADQLTTDNDNLANDKSVSLCAKWAPTENSHFDKKPIRFAKKLTKLMGITPKKYRQMLGALRGKINVLERLLCTNQCDLIKFSQIPSVAMNKNKKVFDRDCNAKGVESSDRKRLRAAYQEYIKGLSKGTEKVNVIGIQPHELVNQYMTHQFTYDQVIESQWIGIKNRVNESGIFRDVTAVVDVSSSMTGIPMQVAIALGLLVSDCTQGSFNGSVITFDTQPKWHKIVGNNLLEKVKCLRGAPWGGTTNMQAVFDLILSQAIAAKLTQDEMVKTLFIFTDMQFNSCCPDASVTTFENTRIKFREQGYEVPKIVCWNLRTSHANTAPFCKNEDGYAMMSGFSAELLKYVLTTNEFNPLAILSNTLKDYQLPHNFELCQQKLSYENIPDLTTIIAQCAIPKTFKKKTAQTKTVNIINTAGDNSNTFFTCQSNDSNIESWGIWSDSSSE